MRVGQPRPSSTCARRDARGSQRVKRDMDTGERASEEGYDGAATSKRSSSSRQCHPNPGVGRAKRLPMCAPAPPPPNTHWAGQQTCPAVLITRGASR
jgi:hypothetical protein